MVSNEDLLAWMKNIHQELKTIRQLNSEMTNFMRDAEAEIPEFMRRFANYMHDLHDIRYIYDELGHDVPQWVLRELERTDDRLRQILVKLHSGGGHFEKVRQEMAEDTKNRWDHTKLLDYVKESHDATRKS